MTLESLRNAVDKLKAPAKKDPDLFHLRKNEIKSGVRKIYNDTGEFMDLLNEAIGKTYFEVVKPDFASSALPQQYIEFFETQCELMPEDITFRIGVEEDMNKNHDLFLQLNRRGYTVSSIRYCSYVRPDISDVNIWTLLDHEELQPMSTIRAKKEIDKHSYSGNDLVDDTNDLIISNAMLKFALTEAEKYINTHPRKQNS